MKGKFIKGICNCNILMTDGELYDVFMSDVAECSGLNILQYSLTTYTGLTSVLPINSNLPLDQQLWFESRKSMHNYFCSCGINNMALVGVKIIGVNAKTSRKIPDKFYNLKIHSMLNNTGGTNTMNHRSDENTKEKMERSDDCKKSCIFKDDITRKCIFETCVQEELPPFQSDTCTIKCIICGNPESVESMSLLTNHRICSDCRGKLLKWVTNCDTVLEHVKSHASHG